MARGAWTRGIGIGLVAVALAACQPSAPPRSKSAPRAGPTPAERISVVQADVLVVDGEHIRLANAYAPQPLPHARCWAEAVAAKQATALVQEIVRNARTVSVERIAGRDEYERSIAHVVFDRQDLGDTLRGEGFAAATGLKRFEWCNGVSQGDAGAPDVRALWVLGGH